MQNSKESFVERAMKSGLVLQRRNRQGIPGEGKVILVKFEDRDFGPEYVVWIEDDKNNRFWGNYHSDYDEAYQDYETR